MKASTPKMDEFSLTASQRMTAKKRGKKKKRQQAKGTPGVHPPQTRPDPQGSTPSSLGASCSFFFPSLPPSAGSPSSQTLSRSLSCQNMKVEGARAFESHRRGQYEGRYGRKSLQKSRGEW